MEKYSESEKYLLESLSIREKVLGKEHLFYTESMNALGALYLSLGNLKKAETFFLAVLPVQEKNLGKDTEDYTLTLSNLGNLYNKMGELEKAEVVLQESLRIREKIYGKRHTYYAASLHNLGQTLSQNGNYRKAEIYYLKAIDIFRTELGSHPFYGRSLNNIGNLYYRMGDLKKSEEFYQRALLVQEKILGKNNSDYASSLLGLGNLHLFFGNYTKAEKMYQEALEILRNTVGDSNVRLAGILNNLGIINKELENFSEALSYYNTSLQIQLEVSGEETLDYADCLNNIGNVYRAMNDYGNAEAYYHKALSIERKHVKGGSLNYARTLDNIGVLFRKTERIKEAEKAFAESLEIKLKLLGKQHPEYIQSILKMGVLNLQVKRSENAISYLIEANDFKKKQLEKGVQYLSEYELGKFSKKISTSKDIQFSIHIKNRRLLQDNFDNVIFFKGFLMETSKRINRLTQNDTTNLELWDRHKSYLELIASEYSKPIAERKNIETLEDKANTIQKELIRKVTGYEDAIRQVEWQEVKTVLQADQAVIEFINYDYYNPDPTDSTLYAALVLRPGDESPHLIPLFEEKQLTALIEEPVYFDQLYGKKTEKEVSLYELIWEPLEDLLKGKSTVYISPSGLLHRINIGAIRKSRKQTIADKQELVMIGSSRQLVIPQEIDNNELTAAIFGGIEYEMDSLALASNSTSTSDDDGQLSFSYLDRSSPERGQDWVYLQGTSKEADAITKMVQVNNGHVRTFKGYQASEESFKQLGKSKASPRILHIATHGFFYPDPEDIDKSSKHIQQELAFKISDHPMIRSGLIMAGGNHVWLGNPTPKGLEDGILTAYEVSQMDLSSTELVVLSACETGLGDIDGNEGVYGLQRAFKIAGAKNLIMSLWAVPDEQTHEMMVQFYDYWLNQKMKLRDAFYAAQKAMRKKYPQHYYWASFVLIE